MRLPDHPTDEDLRDANQRQLFIRDAMPASWLEYAQELADSAEALWTTRDQLMSISVEPGDKGVVQATKSAGHERTYILLVALALENALKGLIVAADPQTIASGQLIRGLKTHSLDRLARQIPGLTLTADEKRVMSICQIAIPYWGRYPIPLDYNGLEAVAAADHEFRSTFRALHHRLCNQLYWTVRDGWDSGEGPRLLKMRNARYGDQIIMSETLEGLEP